MRYWGLLLMCFLVTGARAEDSIWQEWEVGGNGCSTKNVDVLKFGDALAVLFTDLSVKIEPGEKPVQHVQRHCNFRIQVEPPAGHNLVGFTQVYSGGIIKGKRSDVRMDITYRLGSVQNQKSVVWPAGKAILPEDAESVFTRSYSEVNTKTVCREKTMYSFRVHLSAMRKGKDDAVILGLDSVDTEAESGVRFIPKWKPCTDRLRR